MIAQLVEQCTRNAQAASSNLAHGSNKSVTEQVQ